MSLVTTINSNPPIGGLLCAPPNRPPTRLNETRSLSHVPVDQILMLLSMRGYFCPLCGHISVSRYFPSLLMLLVQCARNSVQMDLDFRFPRLRV